MSTNIVMLIISRFIQGLGGSMQFANCLAIIGQFLPLNKIGKAYGVLTTISSIGVNPGAPLGELITYYASWHWNFLINVPIGIFAIWLSAKYIPSEKKEKFSFKEFDFMGALMALFAFTFLILSFNSLDNR